MTTTGELYAIIEELELVDIGEAASYLGEEGALVEEVAGVREPCQGGYPTMDAGSPYSRR